jgi:hypothetical protein
MHKKYPLLPREAVKEVLICVSSYSCEAGPIKNMLHQNTLDIPSILRRELMNTEPNTEHRVESKGAQSSY